MGIILPIINQSLAIGVILIQLLVIVLVINLIFFKRKRMLLNFLDKHLLLIGFLVSLGAVMVSVFYSEVVGFVPCKLCWLTRIFIYPQFILFGIALIRKEKRIINYIAGMSVFGIVISMSQYIGQMTGLVLISCAGGSSCSAKLIFEFGYITIPMMAFSIFALIIALFINHKIGKGIIIHN